MQTKSLSMSAAESDEAVDRSSEEGVMRTDDDECTMQRQHY